MLIFAQCNPVSKLGKDEYLLIKNTITIEQGPRGKKAQKAIKDSYETIDKLDNYYQQKPNTKMLGVFKFHLAAHNFATRRRRKKDSAKDDKHVGEEIDTKIDKIVGEPPVLVSLVSVKKTVEQMQLHLYNKGYFNSIVKDSINYKNYLRFDGGKARINYHITPGPRYTIGKLNYKIKDKGIVAALRNDEKVSLLKIGAHYDERTLNRERERIVKKLKNQGYFFLSKDAISYTADTTLGGQSMALTIRIDRFKEKSESGIVEKDHKRYKIGKIYIQPDFYPEEELRLLDTVAYGDYNFLILPDSKNKKTDRNAYIRFKTLSRKVFMKENEYFKLDNFDNTYKHLAALRIFKFINIEFERSDIEGELICLIQLNPTPKHTIQIEAEGTFASGDLGIAENFTYRNKNIFKGAELLEVGVKTALESQQAFASKSESISDLGLFNTVEIEPGLKLNFPRLLFPIKEEMIPKRYSPKSELHLLYNYQLRSDYTRWIWGGEFAYEWKESDRKTHILAPLNLSSVKIKDDSPILDSAFTDAFIRNSFTNHLISATKYTFIYTTQQLNKKVNFTYFRGSLEVAGNVLRGMSRASNIEPDTSDAYDLFGIQYAQFMKVDVDVRNYNFINKHSTVVFRFAAGLGVPYGNSDVMPFEKSYFSGGANGLRAWQARNVGVGGFQGAISYDQIADIKLEGNIESRFEFIGPLEGAAFIDAGNIWLTHDDPERPDAQFEFNRFYNEIAIGAGLGIRLNYDYFIIRVDAAVKLKDPHQPVGQRWVVKDVSFTGINYNLGIGYPF